MISIVVVSYNTDHHLRSCIESISHHVGCGSYEVIVINNGSPLTSADLQCNGLTPQVVNNAKNIGYAAALNQGIRLSQQPYILCLNADTRLPGSCLEPLVDYLERHPQAGVVAPRLCYPDGTLQYLSSIDTFNIVFLDKAQNIGEYLKALVCVMGFGVDSRSS